MTYIPHRRPLFPLHEAPQVSAEALSRDFGRALKRENDTWPLLVAPSRPCRGMDAPPGRGRRDFSLLGKSTKTKSANAFDMFWPNFRKFQKLKN